MDKTSIPNLTLGEYGYEGAIKLNAWNHFLTDKFGVYNFEIGGDMVEENPQITKEHIEAYHYLLDNQNEIRDKILNEIAENYKDLQESYGYDEEDAAKYMPDIETIDDLRKLMGLKGVHLINLSKDGIAYTGYEFSCTWDEEHGIGVMMHKSRIVKIGGADTSLLSWIAGQDIEG